MTDADKIKVTILPTGAMHADLVWLLIDPSRMASRDNTNKERDWVELPTHVVYIEHPDGTKIMWDAGVPRDWEERWAPPRFQRVLPRRRGLGGPVAGLPAQAAGHRAR